MAHIIAKFNPVTRQEIPLEHRRCSFCCALVPTGGFTGLCPSAPDCEGYVSYMDSTLKRQLIKRIPSSREVEIEAARDKAKAAIAEAEADRDKAEVTVADIKAARDEAMDHRVKANADRFKALTEAKAEDREAIAVYYDGCVISLDNRISILCEDLKSERQCLENADQRLLNAEKHLDNVRQLQHEMKMELVKRQRRGEIAPYQSKLTLEVDDIPQVLIDAYATNDCICISSILKDSSAREQIILGHWIRGDVVPTVEFELEHDPSIPPGAPNAFRADIFESLGYAVWDIESDASMTFRINVRQRNDVKRILALSEHPDYIITHRTDASGDMMTKATLKQDALCFILVQSMHRDKDINACEIQLQLCLLMAMNVDCLRSAIGFLVQDDGMCRTYKATREPRSLMYEQNDLVHVSYIGEVMHRLLAAR